MADNEDHPDPETEVLTEWDLARVDQVLAHFALQKEIDPDGQDRRRDRQLRLLENTASACLSPETIVRFDNRLVSH